MLSVNPFILQAVVRYNPDRRSFDHKLTNG